MLVTVFALLWSALLFAQLVDLAAEWAELRAAVHPTSPGRGRMATWLTAAAVVVVVGAATAASLATALLAGDRVVPGAVVLTVLVFVVGAFALAAVAALLRPTTGGYAGIRNDIALHSASRVTKSDAAGLRHRLAEVDSALAAHPRRLAWLRFIPAVVGLAVVITVVVSLTTAHAWPGWWWLAVVDLVMPLASVLIALASDRMALGARAAWSEVYSAQRAVAETELDLLERRVSRGVTGLTERVSKALGILREQDAQK